MLTTLVMAIVVLAVAQTAQTPIEAKLAEVQKLDLSGTRADSEAAAKILKSLDVGSLTADQRDDWLRYSRDIAIRLADASWLQSLKNEQGEFDSDHVYEVLLAYGKLTKGDIKGSEKLLDSVPISEISVRDARRIYGLKVRIAALKGDGKTERVYLDKMIEHLPSWPHRKCQQCHDSPKVKDKVTSLPLKTLWFGERYVLSLKSMGDAEKVRAESVAALKEDAQDDLAKIRLGYALRALGKGAESDALFDSIPYCTSASHDLPTPRMFFAFP